ncbi:MAG: exodeoxyribonuclease III [Candidatus Westeberhardia cardiocondylae]|nr:exodeoxyribonuclease III [Candidatus Westeberhardia cardiocondylae]
MKFISFNINGIRAHIHQLQYIMEILHPDILCLQETRVHDDLFPINMISKYNYHVYYYGKKSYCGVALLSKKKPITVSTNILYDYNHETKRIIQANFFTSQGILNIINIYCPQGANRKNAKFLEKKLFYKNFTLYLYKNYKKHALLCIMGDMNIAPNYLDIGLKNTHYKSWLHSGKCAFLPEEQQWIKKLLDFGLIDSYRYLYPQKNNLYSWFDYRYNSFKQNIGLRIDLLLASYSLNKFLYSAGIDYKIRAMHKSSDHAPIWANFSI